MVNVRRCLLVAWAVTRAYLRSSKSAWPSVGHQGDSVGMRTSRPNLVSKIVGLGLALLASSCAEAPLPPVQTSLVIPTVRADEEPEQTHDNLTVHVSLLTPENLARTFPRGRVAFMISSMQQVPGVLGASQTVPVQRSFTTNVVPFPSFYVRIDNHTGHVIRFTRSIFRLQDNTGRTFQGFTNPQDLLAWNEADLGPNAGHPQVEARLRSAVNGLNLLTRNTELLNGDSWEGLLAFNTTPTSEYRDLLRGVNRFTLRLAELPVETNQAGEVSRTTEFTFHFDRAFRRQSVTCPPNVEPSLERCTPDNRSGGDERAGAEASDASVARRSGGESPAPARAMSQPDRNAVLAAMQAVSSLVRTCVQGQPGTISVAVVFESTGRVLSANVNPPHAGTPVGFCIARSVMMARVPPFTDSAFRVTYPFVIP